MHGDGVMNRSHEFARWICRVLDQGVGRLDRTIARRLRNARRTALRRASGKRRERAERSDPARCDKGGTR